MPGTLYIVATPIGNLDDMSPRARQTLAAVDLIAAEDTRHSGRLLAHFGIATPQLSLHEHNEAARATQVLEKLRAGQNIALISDAGTPLISDPGFELVRAARGAGICVVPIPGASALITALSVAGLPTDRFVFEGFLPARAAARRTHLQTLAGETRTLIFYEAIHRLIDTLGDMAAVFGDLRQAVVARELTKLHEQIRAGSLAELAAWARQDANAGKGEVVLLVGGAEKTTTPGRADEAARILDILLAELPVKQAAALAAKITGARKNDLYKQALEKQVT